MRVSARCGAHLLALRPGLVATNCSKARRRHLHMYRHRPLPKTSRQRSAHPCDRLLTLLKATLLWLKMELLVFTCFSCEGEMVLWLLTGQLLSVLFTSVVACISTISMFGLARKIESFRDQYRRPQLLWTSAMVCLLMLTLVNSVMMVSKVFGEDAAARLGSTSVSQRRRRCYSLQIRPVKTSLLSRPMSASDKVLAVGRRQGSAVGGARSACLCVLVCARARVSGVVAGRAASSWLMRARISQ